MNLLLPISLLLNQLIKQKIIGGSQNWNGVNSIMFVENVFGVGILLKLPHFQISIIQLTE